MYIFFFVILDNRDRFKDFINKIFEGRFVNQKLMKIDIKQNLIYVLKIKIYMEIIND